MTRTVLLAGLVALVTMPAFASQLQLARSAGVEPGQYSNAQLLQILSLQQEGASRHAIDQILADPRGAPLVPRLSTTTHGTADR